MDTEGRPGRFAGGVFRVLFLLAGWKMLFREILVYRKSSVFIRGISVLTLNVLKNRKLKG